MHVDVREIHHGSPEYGREVQLRYRVLRAPLGLRFAEEDLAKEKTDLHVGAFSHDAVVGCLVLTPLSPTTIKMRQVAVDPAVQYAGVGKQMVAFSETLAASRGYEVIELNARETAVRFYLSQGYEVVGEPFVEVTLPHRKMRNTVR